MSRTTGVAVEHWQLCDVTDNQSGLFVNQAQKVIAVFLTGPANCNRNSGREKKREQNVRYFNFEELLLLIEEAKRIN